MSGIRMLGTGSFVPENRVTNQMMESIVDTSDEWISTRTGIKSRYIANRETSLDMALKASKRAIENSAIEIEDIAVIISATFTGDYMTPSLSCLLQRDLKLAENVLAFDLNAACSGFVYAVNVARSLLAADYPDKYALVVGSERLSKITNFEDRKTCVLFGDGAGAAIIALDEKAPYYFYSGAKGDSQSLFCESSNENSNPFSNQPKKPKQTSIFMDGAEVFRFAVENMKKSIEYVLNKAGLRSSDVDLYVCHQANKRIIASAAKKLKIPIEKFFINIENYGNTSSASIPIALDNINSQGRLNKGDRLILSGFGGGLTYGSMYFVWK